jgi:hypothetical protein
MDRDVPSTHSNAELEKVFDCMFSQLLDYHQQAFFPSKYNDFRPLTTLSSDIKLAFHKGLFLRVTSVTSVQSQACVRSGSRVISYLGAYMTLPVF